MAPTHLEQSFLYQFHACIAIGGPALSTGEPRPAVHASFRHTKAYNKDLRDLMICLRFKHCLFKWLCSDLSIDDCMYVHSIRIPWPFLPCLLSPAHRTPALFAASCRRRRLHRAVPTPVRQRFLRRLSHLADPCSYHCVVCPSLLRTWEDWGWSGLIVWLT